MTGEREVSTAKAPSIEEPECSLCGATHFDDPCPRADPAAAIATVIVRELGGGNGEETLHHFALEIAEGVRTIARELPRVKEAQEDQTEAIRELTAGLTGFNDAEGVLRYLQTGEVPRHGLAAVLARALADAGVGTTPSPDLHEVVDVLREIADALGEDRKAGPRSPTVTRPSAPPPPRSRNDTPASWWRGKRSEDRP